MYLGLSILPLSTFLLLELGKVRTVWYVSISSSTSGYQKLLALYLMLNQTKQIPSKRVVCVGGVGTACVNLYIFMYHTLLALASNNIH